MADHDHDPGPGLDGRVQPSARVQVEVVGGLVQQQDVRSAQQQRGQPQQHRLAARDLADGAVQIDVPEPEFAERRERPLLDVPVVADDLEVLLGHVARLDGVQSGAGGGDAERLVDPQGRVERDVLRQTADLARDADCAVGRGEFARDQLQQGRLPDPLTPTRPVLPGPKATWRSSKTAVPSGQAKEREVQVTGGLDYAELNSVMGGSR